MLVFVLTFLVLSAAAAGLAVGLARGRPLPGGSCREAWLAGHRLPRCEACPGSKPESPQRDPH